LVCTLADLVLCPGKPPNNVWCFIVKQTIYMIKILLIPMKRKYYYRKGKIEEINGGGMMNK
jgi:hypothetical protein